MVDEQTMKLIAVGASLAANCQACLESAVTQALDAGVNAQEILEAMEVGKLVRRGAASAMDQFAAGLNRIILFAVTEDPPLQGCACGPRSGMAADGAARTNLSTNKGELP
jgi:AhpD family alkylhydroperoxidase